MSGGRTSGKNKKALQEGARKKAKGKKNANPKNIFDLEFASEEHEKRYDVLYGRSLTPTKFVDVNTLEKLGLREQVFNLFERSELNKFFAKYAPTYARLTLEFLSSIELCKEDIVAFRLMDEDHKLSLSEFAKHFGLCGSGLISIPSTFNLHAFTRRICYKKREVGDDELMYNSSNTKSTLIYNPALRYVQKALAQSIFSRGDSTGVIREVELYAMSCMLGKKDFNGAGYFAMQLEKIAKSKNGEINVGGFITILATSLGYDVSPLEKLHEPAFLDLNYLINSHSLRNRKGLYVYLQGKQNLEQFALPNPDRTNPLVEANLQPYPAESYSSQSGASQLASSQPQPLKVVYPNQPFSQEGVHSSDHSWQQHHAQSQQQPHHQESDLTDRVSALEKSQKEMKDSQDDMKKTMEAGFSSLTHLIQGFFKGQNKGASGSGTQ